MGKKLLIASGTGNYDHLPEDLQRPVLASVVDEIAQMFTDSLGFSRVLNEISTDPSSDHLRRTLDKWLGSSERDPSDWVVFYYTGHGELVGDNLYLLTRDSDPEALVATAFSAEQLAQMLISRGTHGDKRRVKNYLLILDTCCSAAGVLDAISKLSRFFHEGNKGLFYFLAASLPSEEALAGALARALIQSIGNEALGGQRLKRLPWEELCWDINKRLDPHIAFYTMIGNSKEESQFFPNPRYIPELPSGATVADIRRAVETGELRGFWDPISRGVEVESQPGWYFTGREQVLRELSSWLNNPADARTRVITGRPGAGKSAILARIVTLSSRESRPLMPRQEERLLEAFPPGIIDLAIHAKGKTFQEIADRLASHLETGTSAVLTNLASRVHPFHVVIDALDEATEPARIARDLLTPLLSLAKVKLLVGTRPEYANELGPGAVQLQIDQPEYLDERDLAKYVTARLLGQAQQAAETPYGDDPELARGVAEAVAKRAYPNFLIARLVAEDLLGRSQPISRDEIAQSDFPNSVGAAFEQYMARFGTEQERVRDLLVPLAFAGGLGLPWANVWPAVASGLSGQTYGDADIQWVLDRAGSFVVEALERDRSVYRLYHQALADHLRRGRDPVPTQRRITEALIQTVPGLADSTSKDWRSAQPYIQAHLAEHAAVGGMLPELVKDPLFLLTADADRLIAVMGAHPEGVPPPTMQAYQTSLHLMKTNPLPERASYLEMGARKAMATDLADQISRLPLQRAWDVPWVRWSTISMHRVLAQTTQPVKALAVAVRQGRTVIVSGADDAVIRVWDLESGKEACAPLTGHAGSVLTLTVAERQGQTMVVSGSDDKTIRVWDLESGKEACDPLKGHGDSVKTLAVAVRQGRTVIVSGDDKTIRIWDLESGKEACSPLRGRRGSVKTLAVATRQGRTVIVSGGRSAAIIRVWDLESGKEACAPLTGHRGWGTTLAKRVAALFTSSLKLRYVNALAVATRQGRTVIVLGGGGAAIIRVWDLESGKEACAPLTGQIGYVLTLTVGVRRGRTVIVSNDFPEMIRVWDLESGKEICSPLIGHTGYVNTLALAVWQERAMVVSGSNDGTIRVWDLESGQEAPTPLNTGRSVNTRAAITSYVNALALAVWQGRTVIVSGGNSHTIRFWDLESGQEARAPLTGPIGDVNTLAVAERQGRTVIVSGNSDKSIHVRDLESGQEACPPFTRHSASVLTLTVAERQGRTVIVSGGDRSPIIRIWDLESGQEACSPLNGHTFRVIDHIVGVMVHTVRVNTLAIAERQGRTVVVSGSDDKTIRVWDLESGQEAYAPLTGHTGSVNTLAVAERQGRTVIVSGGYEALIRVWDLESGQEACAPLSGQIGDVKTLAVSVWQGRTVVVSGDYQTIRIWDLKSGESLRRIEVGAPVKSILLVAGSKIVAGTSMGLNCVRLH